MRSAGNGASRSSTFCVTSSQRSNCAGGTITGMRSWNWPTSTFAVVVTIVKVSSGAPPSGVHSSQRPASANSGASFMRMYEGRFAPPPAGVSHSQKPDTGAQAA
jgi:hypothetical protein